MKNILTICLILYHFIILGQKVKNDTLVKNVIYESLYSYKIGQPIYVKYKLYKGGGTCSREKENFNFISQIHPPLMYDPLLIKMYLD